MHLAHPEVGPRVDGAPVGDPAGGGEQPPGGPRVEPRGGGDLLGHRVHLLAGLEVALGVDPVEVPGVQRHQPAGRVEHVDGRRVGPVGVADRVGEHRGQLLLDGQAEHPGGPRLVVRAAVRDDLEQQVGAVDDLAPAGQHRPGQVRTAGGERPAHLRAGTEQHQQAAARIGRGPDVLGDQVEGAHRLPALAAQVGGRHQPAQRRPAGLVAGQQGDPRVPRVDRRPALRGLLSAARRIAPDPQRRVDHRRRRQQPGRLQREVDAEDRPDARRHGGPGELHRAVHAVAVGQREGVHAVLDRALDQDVRVRGAVAQRVARGHVQVDEGVAGDGWHAGSLGSGGLGARV